MPPTAGLVAKFYGLANMATLFGIVMVSHQLGGFPRRPAGRQGLEANGNYDWMWIADIPARRRGLRCCTCTIREKALPLRAWRREPA